MEKTQPKPVSEEEERLNAISERVIGCSYTVSNSLGCGFLEKVYENALALELRKSGHAVEQQKSIAVKYEGTIVGEYFADLLVDRCLIVEIKVAEGIGSEHVAQCLNYLRATNTKLGVILNFGQPRVQKKRVVNNL